MQQLKRSYPQRHFRHLAGRPAQIQSAGRHFGTLRSALVRASSRRRFALPAVTPASPAQIQSAGRIDGVIIRLWRIPRRPATPAAVGILGNGNTADASSKRVLGHSGASDFRTRVRFKHVRLLRCTLSGYGGRTLCGRVASLRDQISVAIGSIEPPMIDRFVHW
jgi:hypothetical protein